MYIIVSLNFDPHMHMQSFLDVPEMNLTKD